MIELTLQQNNDVIGPCTKLLDVSVQQDSSSALFSFTYRDESISS